MATRAAERTTNQAPPRQAPSGNVPAARNRQQAPAQQDEAKRPPAIVQFRDYVQARMATLEDALPPTIPPKRFVSVLMTALQNKPTLLTCTFPSLWNACVRAAQDGLLPDGREGAIAPYGENKDGKRVAEIATWMPMVEGYRKKIFEAGKVKSWTVEVVHEKDDFDYELGDNAYIRHKPFFGAGNPGNVVGAYSIAKLESGEIVREVMSAFKIAQVQAKSKAG
ncbi:MAG: recombinase RecT, partial [Bradyrhizobium sp.]